MASGAERENQDKLRYIQGYKEQIARAEAAGKSNIAAEFATSVADTYERPNIYDHKPLDLAEARKWYAYAAAKGNTFASTNAAYYLGLMYWDGRGGSQDKERAKYIWMWAAENKGRLSVVKLEELGYDMRKERELAFGEAQAYQTRRPQVRNQQESAEAGLAIVFGLLVLSALAHDECYDYRHAQLMGTPLPSPIPEKCR